MAAWIHRERWRGCVQACDSLPEPVAVCVGDGEGAVGRARLRSPVMGVHKSQVNPRRCLALGVAFKNPVDGVFCAYFDRILQSGMARYLRIFLV